MFELSRKEPWKKGDPRWEYLQATDLDHKFSLELFSLVSMSPMDLLDRPIRLHLHCEMVGCYCEMVGCYCEMVGCYCEMVGCYCEMVGCYCEMVGCYCEMVGVIVLFLLLFIFYSKFGDSNFC